MAAVELVRRAVPVGLPASEHPPAVNNEKHNIESVKRIIKWDIHGNYTESLIENIVEICNDRPITIKCQSPWKLRNVLK